jgi:hypothetical protein
MTIDSKQKTVNIALSFLDDGSVISTAISADEMGNHVLPLHYSLTGEVHPTLAPLSIDHSIDSSTSYRYDWVVGVAEPPVWWDWHGRMRTERTIAVQLFIDCRDSGCSFSDSSPVLLGLQPSLHTSSWWDRHADTVRDSVREAAKLAEPLVPVVPGIVQVASNYISSGDNHQKNWWMYRFFSTRRKCIVVEWNINHGVLVEYGPLLRGSIVLSFHGKRKGSNGINLILFPRLGFDKRGHQDINYLPPYEALEDETVELLIEPKEP